MQDVQDGFPFWVFAQWIISHILYLTLYFSSAVSFCVSLWANHFSSCTVCLPEKHYNKFFFCVCVSVVLEASVLCCNLKLHVLVGHIMSMDMAAGVQRPVLAPSWVPFDYAFVNANRTTGDSFLFWMIDLSEYLKLWANKWTDQCRFYICIIVSC